MTTTAHNRQRDLVRLAVLVCGERPSEKYRTPAKGTQNSSNLDPTRGYLR